MGSFLCDLTITVRLFITAAIFERFPCHQSAFSPKLKFKLWVKNESRRESDGTENAKLDGKQVGNVRWPWVSHLTPTEHYMLGCRGAWCQRRCLFPQSQKSHTKAKTVSIFTVIQTKCFMAVCQYGETKPWEMNNAFIIVVCVCIYSTLDAF